MPKKVIIMGAAGRDFHNFNINFRDNKDYEVVAFTATQIPNIEGRKYPRVLAGSLYPEGIPIYPEMMMQDLINKLGVEEVIFAYSDVHHEDVMHKASIVNSCGADFRLMGLSTTMIKANVPLISVCAVRTGAGKSQTTRRIAEKLLAKGRKVVVIRHPMPYGDLSKQIVQRYSTYEDLDKYDCTIEEREEYEPHIEKGIVVYAGVDYQKILDEAEKEADVVLWDGGNNDTSFYVSKLYIAIADPHRPGDGLEYHPGETNLRKADVVIINKVNTAKHEDVEEVKKNVKSVNPDAVVIEAASPISVTEPESIRGKKVLVVEDGPTLTHGEMEYGAGMIAAERFGAAEIVDPKPKAVGSIKKAFKKYPHIKNLLPAMGYGDKQVKDLEDTINAIDCDAVVSATPIDLGRLLNVNKPIIRVSYELDEIGKPDLEDVLKDF
jgi:predicted GTPase